MNKKLIAIEARIADPALIGGVAQVIMSLADGLSRLRDGDEEYVFVGTEGTENWLAKRIHGPCRLHIVSRSYKERLLHSSIGPQLLNMRELIRSASSKIKGGPSAVTVARSDGVVESLGASLVHFPAQRAYLTDCPSLYHPHDLMHVHLPEMFDAKTLRWREHNYRAFCARANVVSVESAWIKNDVVANLNVPEEKVVVIPCPPPTLLNTVTIPGDAAASALAQLPPRFIFYPAQTWPHKNHLRLIDALAILKRQFGLIVPLVATGHQNTFYRTIAARVEEAGLSDQVRFLGYVDDIRLAALYRAAVALVVPTKFDTLSLPVWEAFAAGTPVACSRVTSLPEQLAGAGLLFDPDDAGDMAGAIMKLWQDESLRRDLAAKGTARLRQFSWERTARHFRAIYRRLIGARLDAQDEQLLAAPAMI